MILCDFSFRSLLLLLVPWDRCISSLFTHFRSRRRLDGRRFSFLFFFVMYVVFCLTFYRTSCRRIMLSTIENTDASVLCMHVEICRRNHRIGTTKSTMQQKQKHQPKLQVQSCAAALISRWICSTELAAVVLVIRNKRSRLFKQKSIMHRRDEKYNNNTNKSSIVNVLNHKRFFLLFWIFDVPPITASYVYSLRS